MTLDALTPVIYRVLVALLLALGLVVSAYAQASDEVVETSPLLEALDADGSFSMLAEALRQTGLAADLDPAVPVTLLAPTDEAFKALSAGPLDALTPAALRAILLGHVVDGDLDGPAALTAGEAVATSGAVLSFASEDVTLTVNGATITPNVLAVPGVRVHAVDAVLLPQAHGIESDRDDATDS